MAFQRFLKAPDTLKDYTVDWSKWLDPNSGDSIDTATWTITPLDNFAGVYVGPPNLGSKTLHMTDHTSTGTSATIWLAGGVMNRLYQVTSQIVSAQGRTEDFTFEILVNRT